jgi:hypothetical protein
MLRIFPWKLAHLSHKPLILKILINQIQALTQVILPSYEQHQTPSPQQTPTKESPPQKAISLVQAAQ